jgi:hypothetical protein
MFNKVLVFGWISLGSTLIIENYIMQTQANIFISNNSYAGTLVLVSLIIWACIWFWLKSMLEQPEVDEDKYDF